MKEEWAVDVLRSGRSLAIAPHVPQSFHEQPLRQTCIRAGGQNDCPEIETWDERFGGEIQGREEVVHGTELGSNWYVKMEVDLDLG